MKTQHAVLIVLIGIAQSASAQDCLIPDPDVLLNPSPYLLMVRDVFVEAFKKGVTSRAVVLPAGEFEYAVGLRRTKEGVEVFALKASSWIWETALLKMYERDGGHLIDEKGNTVPLERNEYYQELKKAVP